MSSPVNIDDNKLLYMHPLQAAARDLFLEISKKHGNGKWAFEELEYKLYVEHIDEYEALSEEDKFALNIYMIAFRSLYK